MTGNHTYTIITHTQHKQVQPQHKHNTHTQTDTTDTHKRTRRHNIHKQTKQHTNAHIQNTRRARGGDTPTEERTPEARLPEGVEGHY